MNAIIADAKAKLIDFLAREHFIDGATLQALQKDAKTSGRSFEELLLEKGLMDDKNLGQLIADAHDWSFINLRKESIEENVLKLIPEAVARKQRVIAFDRSEAGIKVAMSNPEDLPLLHLLEKTMGNPVIAYYATPRDINENLYRYQEKIEDEFSQLITAHAKEAAFGQAKDSAIVKLVDLFLAHGYKRKASDIHIDPQDDDTVVRFRIDGLLHDIVRIPKAIHDLVLTRLKVLSRLRIDEHQAPQDGKIIFLFNGSPADIRVSIVPTTRGENAVLRLLTEKSRQLALEDLGLSEKDLQSLSRSIQKPWGMILSTGPTGSGKTTTLYGILKILNTKEVNIDTIEDPVEYDIEGITQIQVNPKANLTFASGLRSIVRQDPDIIMVGEIRDHETADIAVNSAMTGHLVLSTLHTNDAATALPRLLDMGIEPFLVASTVSIIVAQRLMRRVCQRCIMSYETDMREIGNRFPLAALERLARGKEKILLYKGAGCGLCRHTGFSGRMGIYEILEVNEEIRSLIMKNAHADQIRAKAIEQGMTTMADDAIEKVLNGVTTAEEMLRVVKN